MKKHPLGIAGGLTKTFITSPLTPLFLLAALSAWHCRAVHSSRARKSRRFRCRWSTSSSRPPGLKAEDAVKLVTEPLENIIKGINDVEHVYSQTYDNQVMVTARFKVGTPSDSAVLRVHDKVMANMSAIPVGIPEPLIIGRTIDDVAIIALTLTPDAKKGAGLTANDLSRVARELQTELTKIDNVGLTYLVGETGEAIRVAPDPERLALYGVTLNQLTNKVTAANRALFHRQCPRQRPAGGCHGRRDVVDTRRNRQSSADDCRWPTRLRPRCRRCRFHHQ